jgi:uncharacterized membrane protein
MAEENATPASTGLSDNAAGAIAYLTIIPAIIFLLVEPYNKNAFVRFHSFQCLFLCGVVIAGDIALAILFGIVGYFLPLMAILVFPLWWLWALFILAVIIFCIVQAYQGKKFQLPFIGALAAKQAGA